MLTAGRDRRLHCCCQASHEQTHQGDEASPPNVAPIARALRLCSRSSVAYHPCPGDVLRLRQSSQFWRRPLMRPRALQTATPTPSRFQRAGRAPLLPRLRRPQRSLLARTPTAAGPAPTAAASCSSSRILRSRALTQPGTRRAGPHLRSPPLPSLPLDPQRCLPHLQRLPLLSLSTRRKPAICPRSL